MRSEITNCLASANFPEETQKVLKNMQKDCRLFLDKPFSLRPGKKHQESIHVFVNVMENFRFRFGINISKLCIMYGVPAEGELASLVIRTKSKLEKRSYITS